MIFFQILVLFFLSSFQISLSSSKPSLRPLLGTNLDEEYLPAGMLSPVSSRSQAGSPTKSSPTTSRFDGADYSSSSSQSFDGPELFSNKKKLLALIRSYLKSDKKVSDSDLIIQMKQLQKKPFAQLTAQFEQDLGFAKRYQLLQYLKTFLMRYQDLSEDKANAQINQLQDVSIDQIHQKYYGWCQRLTKDQMLAMIHDNMQFDRGFFGTDADQEVAELAKEPLLAVRDRFMQYQRTFVTKDLSKEASESLLERKNQIHKQFEKQTSNRSLICRVPLVHNITALLPSKITNWSDSELFAKIEEKMRDLGFTQSDIDREIQRLQQASIKSLQADYPHLQSQLASRLYYFDTVKHQDSSSIKSVDFWLQQLHVWGTTVGALGLSAAGYDMTAFSATIGLTLLDPRLTFSSGVTKRDLLDMVYAQYSTFDALKHAYLNPEYKEVQLWTKSELVQNILDCLNDLNITTKARDRLEVKCHHELSKQELEALYEELSYVAYDKRRLVLSNLEKKVLLQTKPELLDSIQEDLRKLKISQDKIDQKIEQLSHEDIRLIRAARVDAYEATTAKRIKLGVMPMFTTRTETLLKQAPKVIAQTASVHVLSKLSTDLKLSGKSPIYIHWKVTGLQNHVDHVQDGAFEHVTSVVKRGYDALALVGLRHQLPELARHVSDDRVRTIAEGLVTHVMER